MYKMFIQPGMKKKKKIEPCCFERLGLVQESGIVHGR